MKFSFPWLAAGIGLILAMVLLQSGVLGSADDRSLPLLTQLFISEFGFLVTAAGSFTAGRALRETERKTTTLMLTLACAALAIAFFVIGLQLWQGTAG